MVKINIVNENDESIGAEDKDFAIEQGLIHQVVRIFVFNDKNELYLQKRGANQTFPNTWDQSAGGHVDEGETYEEAALRELQEELGISGVGLKR